MVKSLKQYIVENNYDNNKIYKSILFLDRDGVILKNVIRDSNEYGSARNVAEMEYETNIRTIIQHFLKKNIAIFVVTNQPDVNKGFLMLQDLRDMNKKMIKDLMVHGIVCCPHTSAELCECRKPGTKMVIDIIQNIKTEKNKYLMVGDRISDIMTGLKINIETIHIAKNCENCGSNNHFENLEKSRDKIMELLEIDN